MIFFPSSKKDFRTWKDFLWLVKIERRKTRWKLPFQVNSRDACWSLTSVTNCAPLSLEWEETMGWRVCSRAECLHQSSLAPPLPPRASSTVGKKVQSYFSGNLKTATTTYQYVRFLHKIERKCMTASWDYSAVTTARAGPGAEPAPHCVLTGPYPHLIHPPHFALPNHVLTFHWNQLWAYLSPGPLPCSRHYALFQHLHSQL